MGTAYFDDLALSVEPIETNRSEAAGMPRGQSRPSSWVRYARNLLVNGDLEAGTPDGKPVGWTYMGKSAPDWPPPRRLSGFKPSHQPTSDDPQPSLPAARRGPLRRSDFELLRLAAHLCHERPQILRFAWRGSKDDLDRGRTRHLSAGQLMIGWANADERDLSLEVPAGHLTVMDMMGNRQPLKAVNGVVTVQLTPKPVYLFEGGDIAPSHQLDSRMEDGGTQVGKP